MITAIDSSSFPNLVIIGEGKWGMKILNILKNENLNVSLISARDFLNKPQDFAKNGSNSIFWICSRPDLQLAIAIHLANLKVQKIIIEKPYFRTKEEFDSLVRLIESSERSKFFVSEPWAHSALWREGKKVIYNLYKSSSRISIKVDRGSDDLRDFINPVQDWLPHDIGLLFDLSMTLGKSKIEFLGIPIIKKNLLKGRCAIGDKIEIDFAIGYKSDGRIAQWKVATLKDSFVIDFTNLSLKDQKNTNGISAESFRADNPLVNQFEWVVQQKSDDFLSEKIDLQKKALIQK